MLLAGGLAFGVFSSVRKQQLRQPPAGVESIEGLVRGHVDGQVSYATSAPVGGEHGPVWQDCGYYAAPVADEAVVHSLEHGAVWIAFRPELPREEVASLRELAEGQSFVLVSPVPDLPAPLVASAWGKQLRLDSATAPELAQFVRAFRLGPQTLEPGASCIGGTSATV